MNQTVLLTGCPESVQSMFIDSAVASGNQIMTTGAAEKKTSDAKMVSWTRSSPISARTVLLQAQNAMGIPGQVILYFDAAEYAAAFSAYSLETITRGTDEMILGYQYLVNEAVNRIQSGHDANLVFYLQNESDREYGIMTAVAEAAFAALAEKTAELYAGKNFGVVLVKADQPVNTESTQWLFQYLQNDAVQKNARNPKHAAHWIKPLSKVPGVLSLLTR